MRCHACDTRTHGRTHEQWKVEQYSVWAESAIHSGEKGNKCDQCSFASSRASSLKRHMVIHFGGKSFKCDQCTYASSRASDLRRHMGIHSGGKPFKCDQCRFTSAWTDALRSHLKIHQRAKLGLWAFNEEEKNWLAWPAITFVGKPRLLSEPVETFVIVPKMESTSMFIIFGTALKWWN